MSDQPKQRPDNCRNALQERGESYPRSGCAVCGNVGIAGCPYDRQDAAALELKVKQLEAERDEAFAKGKQAFEDLRRVEAKLNALAAEADEWEELTYRFQDESDAWRRMSEQYKREAYALAAHVEALKQAGELLRHELAQWSLTERDPETTSAMCQFEHIARETPTTSLARREAAIRRDEVESVLSVIGAYPDRAAVFGMLRERSEELRRQAQEPTE